MFGGGENVPDLFAGSMISHPMLGYYDKAVLAARQADYAGGHGMHSYLYQGARNRAIDNYRIPQGVSDEDRQRMMAQNQAKYLSYITTHKALLDQVRDDQGAIDASVRIGREEKKAKRQF
jgi:DNA-directed RNA polymerase specialized sigma24 family protein